MLEHKLVLNGIFLLVLRWSEENKDNVMSFFKLNLFKYLFMYLYYYPFVKPYSVAVKPYADVML